MHIHFFQTISLRSPNVSALEKEFLGPYSTYPYQLQKESLPLYSLTMSQSDSLASSVESSPTLPADFYHVISSRPFHRQNKLYLQFPIQNLSLMRNLCHPRQHIMSPLQNQRSGDI